MNDVYLISGHADLKREEFDKYYVDKINTAINNNGIFILSDKLGIDFMAQKYLSKLTRDNPDLYNKVTVYFNSDKPDYNVGSFMTVKVYDTDDIDETLVNSSTKDISWIRPELEQKKKLNNKFNIYHITRPMKISLLRQKINLS